jgi:hypothetical protein
LGSIFEATKHNTTNPVAYIFTTTIGEPPDPSVAPNARSIVDSRSKSKMNEEIQCLCEGKPRLAKEFLQPWNVCSRLTSDIQQVWIYFMLKSDASFG